MVVASLRLLGLVSREIVATTINCNETVAKVLQLRCAFLKNSQGVKMRTLALAVSTFLVTALLPSTTLAQSFQGILRCVLKDAQGVIPAV
jgi:hypothetical protein